MSPDTAKSRRNYKRKFALLNSYNGATALMLAFLIAGVIMGSVSANTMDNSLLSDISKGIESGLYNISSGDDRAYVFKESMFKHVRIIVLVWILMFIWAGVFLQLIIIGFKGFSIGHMVSVFVMELGKNGLVLSAGIFAVQNAVMVLMFMFIAHSGLAHALEKFLKKWGRALQKEASSPGLPEQIIILLICMFGAMLIALYEAYICPVICAGLLFR